MSFEPIAIVGQGCVLPGALTPDELWQGVLAKRDFLTEPPEGYLRLAEGHALDDEGGTWSDRGGYVRGFAPPLDGYSDAWPVDALRSLDPVFLWALHAARCALEDSGGEPGRFARRAGAIMGNLSLPTRGLWRVAESVWRRNGVATVDDGVTESAAARDPRNRFTSGLPAHILHQALGLGAGGFALDAACASSLYSIKLACDRLHDRRADLMLAGAVNAADPLFLHLGFRALGAISPSGRSRPFHQEADGLVPSEGAVFFALKRLDDAVAAGDRIYGVIRGVGLSNDGGEAALLAPCASGQVRALRAAYEAAGIDPGSVSYVECHATGTVVGDRTEIAGMRTFFGDRPLAVGSLKSNMGHLITASGAAGLMKVLRAFQDRTLPPMLHTNRPIPALAASPFRLVDEAAPWESDTPRIAGVSSFGFGGTNAHLVVEEYVPKAALPRGPIPVECPQDEIAIVAVGAVVGDGQGRRDFERALLDSENGGGEAFSRTQPIRIPVSAFRFPPHDLAKALPQQTLMLLAAEEAVAEAGVGALHLERTGVFVGLGCEVESAWYVVQERNAREAPDRRKALDAPTVVGLLPNIPANRINHQWRLKGPGYTVSAEELSGVAALEIAVRALRRRELDAAIVGAVDFSSEPVHAFALRTLVGEDAALGDGAVALVLKRRTDAEREGDRIVACVDVELKGSKHPGAEPAVETRIELRSGNSPLTSRIGHPHAASGLLHVAAGALACYHRGLPSGSHAPEPAWNTVLPAGLTLSMEALGGATAEVRVTPVMDAVGPGLLTRVAPTLHVFRGSDLESLNAALKAHAPPQVERGGGDAWVVAIVATGELELQRKRAEALTRISEFDDDQIPRHASLGDGIAFGRGVQLGEIAAVLTGAAAGRPRMGGELYLAFPEAYARALQIAGAAPDASLRSSFVEMPELLQALAETSIFTQMHAALTLGLLKLRPTAAIGLSSGETNALAAFGAWDDMAGLLEDLRREGLYSRELAGSFDAVRRAWSDGSVERVEWRTWRLFAPVTQVEDLVAAEPRVHVAFVHTENDCVIAGEKDGCERIVSRFEPHAAAPLKHNLAVHVPELAAVGDVWRAIHRRPTRALSGVRFYSGASGEAYSVSGADDGELSDAASDLVADRLLAMASQGVDFRAAVLRAWEDGVRIFVEHGPKASCTRWIHEILGEREHVAVALDARRESEITSLFHAAAELVAAGVAVDVDALNARTAAMAAPVGRGSGGRATRERSESRGPFIDVAPHPPERTSSAPDATLPTVKSANTMPVAPPLVGAPPGSFTEASAAGSPVRRLQSDVTSAVPEALEPGSLWGVHAAFLQRQGAIYRTFLETQSRVWRTVHARRVAVQEPYAGPTAQALTEHVHAVEQVDVSPEPAPVVRFSREELEYLSWGRISALFGPRFEAQDPYERQVRMPMPPLLLADRVTRLEGEPAGMGVGTVWTETDVRWDSWYLNEGKVPFGILIECGQADLLLISWLGIDLHNKGERVYRLLGCDLTLHGRLPRAGDTLRFEIHVDGHARHGDVRLFFFHYDCYVGDELRMSVRGGQAGFFSDQELRESAGILWDAETAEYVQDARLDPPVVPVARRSFDEEQVRAFAEGRVDDCFGSQYRLARTHTRTPRIQTGRMQLIQRVPEFDPTGGPWGRGYLRAEYDIQGNEWFFPGHFKNDPAMPGTLMGEACVQAMAFYMAALGFTLDKDGWSFEPVPHEPYRLRCRGQVVPSSKRLVYEVFVEEVISGPIPTVYADVLMSVDGLKSFHCRRLGLSLVPDWPQSSRPELADGGDAHLSVAEVDGFRFDYASLIACALGRPSDAFGPRYRGFDGERRVPRLPGPPYHFMSRVRSVEGTMGEIRSGARVVVEYDVPPDAWYFEESPGRAMPFAVLLEVGLQPCGWLTAYLGIPLSVEEDLFFRNLDGAGVCLRDVRPDAGSLRTEVECTNIARAGKSFIESFTVRIFQGDELVFRMNTVFGHFLKAALEQQAGLPASAEETELLRAPSDFLVDLTERPARYFEGSAALPSGKLLMLDRVNGYWEDGGEAGLGRLRAEMTVRPESWFFKAHFFQDPVQPGSLGVEAMIQLLQFYMVHRDMAAGIPNPRFLPLARALEVSWKYRGQVRPTHDVVTVELEVTRCEPENGSAVAEARAWLWVDGVRIYQADRLAVRIVAGNQEVGA